MGIFVSGGSIGVMVMPLLFEAIIELYGWRGALLLLGALNTHLIFIGSLLKPPKKVRKRTDGPVMQDGGEFEGHSNVTHETVQIDIDKIGEDDQNSDLDVREENPDKTVCHPGRGEQDLALADQVGRKHLSSSKCSTKTNIDGGTSTGKEGISTIEAPCQSDEAILSNNTDPNVNKEIVAAKQCSWKIISSSARLFKEHPIFIMLCYYTYFFIFTYVTWLPFTIPNAQEKGLSDPSPRAAQLSVAGGVANFLGRLSCGVISSRKLASIEGLYVIANLISSGAFFVNYVAESFSFLLILSLIFGISNGYKTSAQFSLVMNAVGQENYKKALAIKFLVGSSTYHSAGFIAGEVKWLFHKTVCKRTNDLTMFLGVNSST
nr:uncharacterized protein LOC129277333 [Lytechinus pictus]